MKKAKEYPVRIVTRTHPHAGELGVIRADDDGKTEVMTMGKLKLFKVWLTNCPEGQESGWAALSNMVSAGTPRSLT